jgi:hypothetical protein
MPIKDEIALQQWLVSHDIEAVEIKPASHCIICSQTHGKHAAWCNAQSILSANGLQFARSHCAVHASQDCSGHFVISPR